MGGFARIKLVPIRKLKPHEQVVEEHVRELMEEILRDEVLKDPIYVDMLSYVILDGHHRTEALTRLGCKRIPAVLVCYGTPEIKVHSWREGVEVRKGEVLYRGLNGLKLPPKTSKHKFPERIRGLNIELGRLL